jgi:hypothetical protein
MDDIPLTIEEQLIQIGHIVFQNIEDDIDKVEINFKDNNFDFYDPKEINFSKTKIIKNPNKNKLLKKYLFEATNDEKFVFTLQIFTNTCVCSDSKKYVGEILLNTNPDYANGYELHIYEKVKRGVYRTEYILVSSYLSQ